MTGRLSRLVGAGGKGFVSGVYVGALFWGILISAVVQNLSEIRRFAAELWRFD